MIRRLHPFNTELPDGISLPLLFIPHSFIGGTPLLSLSVSCHKDQSLLSSYLPRRFLFPPKSREIKHFFDSLESFKKAMNAAPNGKWVMSRSFGNGKSSRYIPLFVQQALADRVFRECDVISETYQVIQNEILCVVKLSILPDYPHAEHRYITGVAAKPIQCDAKSVPANFPDGKKSNALEYNAPASNSAAVSNALTKFANVFGRNLNREVSDGYSMQPKEEPKTEKNES